MRYRVLFSNGYWALFDTQDYRVVDTFPLQANALSARLFANETGEWRASGWASRPWAVCPW